MQARQSEEMALAQSFLNRLWQVEHDGKRWFNPDISIIYPDRIRRRPPHHIQRTGSAYRLRRAGALASASLSAGIRQCV